MAGQLPGPPLKVACRGFSSLTALGLAGQLPGPPLKGEVGSGGDLGGGRFGRAIALGAKPVDRPVAVRRVLARGPGKESKCQKNWCP